LRGNIPHREAMREYLQTKHFDCSEMAKTNIRRSRRVLGLALVGKLSLRGFSGVAETSLNLPRRAKGLVEGKGRERETMKD
jgi:hypothetical protein